MNIEDFIAVIKDGSYGFSPSIIAVPYLSVELKQRGVKLSTLEMHFLLERITSHYRYGKIKWEGKAPLVYAHRRLEGANTDAIRAELWRTERYASKQARMRERVEAIRRWKALQGRVVDIKQF